MEATPVEANAHLFTALFESHPEAIFVAGGRGVIVMVNGRAQELFGYERDELVGQPIEMLVPTGRRAEHAVRRAAYARRPRNRPMGRGLDLQGRRKDGSGFPVDIMLSPVPTDQGVLIIAVVRDVTEDRRALQRLEQLADRDPLTEVFNRRRFERDLAAQLTHARRYGAGALLIIDVDDFKAINDTFGHRAGDQVLRTVATRLRSRIRDCDVVARIGGDEFAVLLAHASAADAQLVAEQLADVIRASPLRIEEADIVVTVSIGVAPMGSHATTADAVLKVADTAMYRAKGDGRDRVWVSLTAERAADLPADPVGRGAVEAGASG